MALKNERLTESDRTILNEINDNTREDDNPLVFYGKFKRKLK